MNHLRAFDVLPPSYVISPVAAPLLTSNETRRLIPPHPHTKGRTISSRGNIHKTIRHYQTVLPEQRIQEDQEGRARASSTTHSHDAVVPGIAYCGNWLREDAHWSHMAMAC